MDHTISRDALAGGRLSGSVGKNGFSGLVIAAVLTVILWHVPGGNYILYPFTILATWFHEMAHGSAALLLGGHFEQLLIFSNGSGLAYYMGPLAFGSLGQVMVSAAGPMGPPIAGAALILSSCRLNTASLALRILAGALLVSAVVWVRSPFGLVAVPLLGLVILGISIKASQPVQGWTVQFLGVQACISTYRQLDYLFSYSAGQLGISDTAQIQSILLLPYWFWGGLMAIFSLLILAASLRRAYRNGN